MDYNFVTSELKIVETNKTKFKSKMFRMLLNESADWSRGEINVLHLKILREIYILKSGKIKHRSHKKTPAAP